MVIDDLISRRAAIKDICDLPNCDNGYSDTYDKACIIGVLEEQQPVDAVPVVRCKDCKHRPIDTGGHNYGQDLLFPDDYKCPCRCEDQWYSWMPRDDWFCANGERSEE